MKRDFKPSTIEEFKYDPESRFERKSDERRVEFK